MSQLQCRNENQHFISNSVFQFIKKKKKKKTKITKDKNSENVPRLKIAEVVLVHCSIVNNEYQHDSRFSFTFAPDKLVGQLINISTKNFVFPKTFTSEFPYFEVWFINSHVSKQLHIEDTINITLVVKGNVRNFQTRK